MKLEFTNRVNELRELDSAEKHGGLLVVFGRRRVGKTRLLAHWIEPKHGLYSQAIEGARDIQIDQVFQDIKGGLETNLVPKTWSELFELIGLKKKKTVFCLDEFPYLVASDPSLPSVIQRWIDHAKSDRCLLILAGSSTRMMNDLFLNRGTPLYNRAQKLLHVRPMDYAAFCDACNLDSSEMDSFDRFSLVGGIPKYWEFVEPDQTAIELAEALFFGFAPYLEQEPRRILRDEGISGMNAVSLMETIGRGAEKPSEMAARLGTRQTNLSRLLEQLLDASVLERETPFGESTRNMRKTLYRIHDPTLRFWFRVFSPHRSRWHQYGASEKAKLIHDHASTVFEDYCRNQHPGAARYWEGALEFDFLRSDHQGQVVVSEVKWKKSSLADKNRILKELEEKWRQSTLFDKYQKVEFELIDASILQKTSK